MHGGFNPTHSSSGQGVSFTAPAREKQGGKARQQLQTPSLPWADFWLATPGGSCCLEKWPCTTERPGHILLSHGWALRTPRPVTRPHNRSGAAWSQELCRQRGAESLARRKGSGSSPALRGMTGPSMSTLPRGPALLTREQHEERAGERPTPLLKAAGETEREPYLPVLPGGVPGAENGPGGTGEPAA